MKFYSNVQQYGNKLLVRGYDSDGFAFKAKIPYEPTLYIPAKKNEKFITLEGDFVLPKHFHSIKEAKNFVKMYDEVDNYPIYGLTDFKYTYIQETYAGCKYDFEKLKIVGLDIEVECEGGFPSPEVADEIINAITLGYRGKLYSWGLPLKDSKKFSPGKNVKYIECKTEKELLQKFLLFWVHIHPDIVTGWNIEFFDIPYLVIRMREILGEKATKLLSPWKMIREKNVRGMGGKELLSFELIGLSVIDYLQAYKKFTFTTPENFKLNTICELELGEKKIDYSEVGKLHLLYKTDYPKFMRYNNRDVELIFMLEDKLKLLEMIINLAYDAGVNYNDTFTQVRMWDVLIHNELMAQNIVIPPKKTNIKRQSYAGAAVKEPKPGAYKWIMSYDLTSLYPHLIMQYNISPETLVEDMFDNTDIEDMIAGKYKNETKHCLAANGYYFKRDKQGFLPSMMERLYTERKMYKGKMLEEQQKLEDIKAEISRRNL